MLATNREWKDYDFNIRVFPSKKDMLDAATSALDFNQKNIKPRNSTYEDKVEKYDLDNMLDVKMFESPKTLDKGLTFFDKLLVDTDMGGAFKKSKLKITDDTRGIFDFGLASQGLFRAIEYYSKELEIDSPNEFPENIAGIVNDKFITTKKIVNKNYFYYKSPTTNKEYELTQQQEGTKEMLNLNPNALIKKTKNGLIYTEPSSYTDLISKKKVSLKFKTKNKKSYLMFEKKGGKAKMIELYFPIHGSIELKHILPLLLVAKYLKQAGIMTRINILRMYHEKSKLFVMYGYPIKDYGDEIDFNEIALNGVDGRWWSAMRVMVRALNDQDEAKKYLKMNVKPGTSMRYYDGAGSEAGSHNDYAEVFSRYRNWYMDQIKQGLMPPLRVDKKLILFGGVWEGYGSMEEMKDEIIGEFFRVLDTVDFQFNNAEQTCKRIYKRRVTDKLAEFYREKKASNNPVYSTQDIVDLMKEEKEDLTYKFRNYVQGLLNTTYSYPVEGFYAEPEESAKKLDDEFEEKLEDLNKFLKTV
tara:strand:- start:2210 stop:3790 length:1581 start_codon:yes stop_codon:yes gene_type:complete